ncbi:Aste57867_18743 [Aphanomyces stellatus]|uniref:Aste57867_18743 protein n=1 Tax=Aphanomyces stellatus TaxID=120398 RepID=A0A485LB86_9STRA|nr:hypothetical protein As57867_018679 [Aphanomyces stellatus]VFT95477.1 Aste57867_18743 [Aphanomyces stellatus]
MSQSHPANAKVVTNSSNQFSFLNWSDAIGLHRSPDFTRVSHQVFTLQITFVAMGLFASKLKSVLNILSAKDRFSIRGRRIIIVGLDAAGKTTILYKFKMGQVRSTVPTIGFNVETFQYKNIEFTMWDIGGQDKLRGLWKLYYQNTDAVIFVVDSNDHQRIHVAAEELRRMLQEDELQHAKVLVYANKQDLGNAMTPAQVSAALQLNLVTGHATFVQPCSAVSGQGLYEGLEWLNSALNAG